jgi:hypothetical protein
MSDLFGTAGRNLLETCALGDAYAVRVASLRQLIEVLDSEIAMLAGPLLAKQHWSCSARVSEYQFVSSRPVSFSA